jgi:hypothetical protein
MPGPWEQYGPTTAKPWEKYGAAPPKAPGPNAATMRSERRIMERSEPEPRAPSWTSIGTPQTAAMENLLSMGTGMVATPVAEFGAAIAEAKPSGTLFGKSGDEIARMAGDFTYQPRTALGQGVQEKIGAALSPISRAVEWSADTDNPDAGVRATGHLAKGVLGLVGLKGMGGVRAAAPRAGGNAAINTARELGYALEPRQVVHGEAVGSVGQRAAASFGGKAALPAEGSLKNQAITQRLVAEDLGLPPGEYLTPATIKTARTAANSAYQSLRNLTNSAGKPFGINLARDAVYLTDLRGLTAKARSGVTGHIPAGLKTLIDRYSKPQTSANVGALMDDIAALREEARVNFKSANPDLSLARTQRGIADALEGTLERQVASRYPQLVGAWRAARTQLAKLHAVEDAMVGAEIDGRLLAKAREHGALLTGNMAKIADVAEVAPQMMQAGANLGSRAGPGLLDTSIAAGSGAVAGAALGGPAGAGLGAIAAPLAWQTARYGARKYAMAPGSGVMRAAAPTAAMATGAALAGEQQEPDARRRAMAEALMRSR